MPDAQRVWVAVVLGAVAALGGLVLGAWIYFNVFWAPFVPDPADVEAIESIEAANRTGHETASAVAVHGERIVVAAHTNSRGAGGYDAWILQLDAGGAPQWDRVFGSERDEFVRDLVRLADGEWMVVGEVQTGPVTYDGFIQRFDDRGEGGGAVSVGDGALQSLSAVTRWGPGYIAAGTADQAPWVVFGEGRAMTIEHDAPTDINDVLALSEGVVVLVGGRRSTAGDGEAVIIVLDGDGDGDGTVRQDLDLDAGELSGALSLDGGDWIAVGHQGHPHPRAWVLRLSGTLDVVWQQQLPSPSTARATGVARLASGDLVVAGFELSSTGFGRKVLVARLTVDGELVWRRTFGGDDWDWANGVAATPDGGAVVVGGTTDNGKTDARVRRVDADGELLWERTFGQP